MSLLWEVWTEPGRGVIHTQQVEARGPFPGKAAGSSLHLVPEALSEDQQMWRGG